MGEAEQTSYVAHLGGPEAFGELMWAEARRRDWLRAREARCWGMGRSGYGTWRGCTLESLELVDWYHAVEHLGVAARLLHGSSLPTT